MSRWNPYCFISDRESFFEVLKEEETTPIRNSQITQYLSKSKVTTAYNKSTQQATVVVHGDDNKVHAITFSQQEGNCNGLWFCRPMGNPDIVTHLAKNIMSLLGDNVGFITHHAPSMKFLEGSGWNVIGEYPSNRGYKYPIQYAMIHLPKEYMTVGGFATFTKGLIKKVQDKVGDVGTVLNTEVVISDSK